MNSRPVKRLDSFLVSNGGVGTVPRSVVSLAREFAEQFNFIIRYRAYSALGQLGPIDPSVSNDFNPREPQTNRPIQISVEDVKAYVQFIKETVGITYQDELVKTIEILAEKAHPLPLGNVERFVQQSLMIAKKILRTYMSVEEDHAMNEVIENLASKLYFHGHHINRKEAKQELRLKVATDLAPELKSAIWNLYLEYEQEFDNAQPFSSLEGFSRTLIIKFLPEAACLSICLYVLSCPVIPFRMSCAACRRICSAEG